VLRFAFRAPVRDHWHMSLAIIGAGASYEFRWRTWALLRDVLVANLDESTLAAFCALGSAMVEGTVRVKADELAADIGRIREWLVGKPFSNLVIGPRTSALVHFTQKAIRPRPLNWNEINRIRPIADSTDLAEYFATMLESFTEVCAHPAPDGTLEIVDG
jgi:hypothetical protein